MVLLKSFNVSSALIIPLGSPKEHTLSLSVSDVSS